MTQALANCPFCGSTETFVCECEDETAGCSTFWAECQSCDARGSTSEYKEGAILYWNKATRTSADKTADRGDAT